MHLNLQLTENVEIGAVQTNGQEALDVVTTDGGQEVRNLRVEDEPRQWQIAIPTIDTAGDTADFDSVRTMWGTSAKGTFRGLHTFNFHDFVDDVIYRVRFASAMPISAAAGHLRHIDTFTIRETLDTGPEPTADPAITGTQTVGDDLSVSNGTWSGSPTSYAYQWTRDDVDIADATSGTYTIVSADSGKMIGCYVTATDANGNATRTWADAVGPIA